MATAGLFGAVSASMLAAGVACMAVLDSEGVAYEGHIGVLYPFMDVAALVTAIVLARVSAARAAATPGPDGTAPVTVGGGGLGPGGLRDILSETARSPAISALLLGVAIGLIARPDAVYADFYEPLFRGLLSLRMLTMGMEAWSRLSELRRVAHAYVLLGLTAPLIHGVLRLAVGLALPHLVGVSGGGAVLLAVMAASRSDISGPPALRGALPEANPSAYGGATTGLGTPMAILSIPLWMALADRPIGL